MALRRSIFVAYVLTLFFVGLGYLAILPVFEGFDENAHFSSLREIADGKTIPVYGKSSIDKEVVDYQGPTAWGSLDPPFDKGLVYSKFFSDPALVEDYLRVYRQPHQRPAYAASGVMNWEAQHPPLYYLLLAPLEKLTESMAFVTQILVLRIASYLLALLGVVFALSWVIRSTEREEPALLAGFVLYPIILPMFFPEFTRIGSDSLCLLLTGLLALLLSEWNSAKDNRKLAVAIGITVGLGLVTKAFFIPIAMALAIFLILRSLKRDQREWQGSFLILALAFFIGGGWYFYKFMTYGDPIGSNDAIQLAQQGGFIANLEQHFSFYAFARGILATIVSWSWGGTWSLARLPTLLHVPLLALTAWIVAAYLLQLRRRPLTDPAWLSVWLFSIFGCGFLYHILISIAINGNGNTPGWYLHILMPWAAPAVGIGAHAIWQHHPARPVLVGSLLYAVLFQATALWAQIALFTGCATKDDNKYYSFSGHYFCLDQADLLTARLAVLGWPMLAVAGFAAGVLCALWLVFKLVVLRKQMLPTGGPQLTW
jgi:4-amino-4-deoxy-L-arabinose transferase-like glycosyltransferase